MLLQNAAMVTPAFRFKYVPLVYSHCICCIDLTLYQHHIITPLMVSNTKICSLFTRHTFPIKLVGRMPTMWAAVKAKAGYFEQQKIWDTFFFFKSNNFIYFFGMAVARVTLIISLLKGLKWFNHWPPQTTWLSFLGQNIKLPHFFRCIHRCVYDWQKPCVAPYT